MLRIRKSCLDLSAMRLHCLEPGTVYSLDDMVAQHAAHCVEVAQVCVGTG